RRLAGDRLWRPAYALGAAEDSRQLTARVGRLGRLVLPAATGGAARAQHSPATSAPGRWRRAVQASPSVYGYEPPAGSRRHADALPDPGHAAAAVASPP